MGLKLVGEVALDGSGFERGLKHIGHAATENLKSFVTTAFGLYGIEQAIEKTVESASNLVNESKRIQVSVEQLQLLKESAKQSGTELGTLVGVFEKINIARQKAMARDAEAEKFLKSFRVLGVTNSDLQTKTAADIFMGPISAKIRSTNVSDISTDLKNVLGKGFGEVVATAKTDFGDLEAKMRALGTIMDTETALKLHRIGSEFGMLSQILVVQAGPAIIAFVEAALEAVGKLKGVGAFWGAIAANMESLTPQNAKPEVLTKEGKINFWKAIWAEMFGAGAKQGGESPVKAFTEEDEKWKATLEKIRKELDEEAEKLKTPPALFNDHPPEIKPFAKEPSPDALIKVGNFLGSTRSAIDTVAQQHLDVARKTLAVDIKMAADTAAMLTALRASLAANGIPVL